MRCRPGSAASGRSPCSSRWSRPPRSCRARRAQSRSTWWTGDAACAARCSASSIGCAGPAGSASNAEAQRRFSILRLRFNAVLTQFDLFSDVITQRSEHETGVWLSGLDVASADALTLPREPGARPAGDLLSRSRGGRRDPPGAHAAARRRRRTRWRSSACRGSAWSAAASRPRSSTRSATRPTRCSSLVGIAAPDPARHAARQRRDDAQVWQYFERCISEIVATSSSVARVGHRLERGADRRRQPAPGVRVPSQPRRPAPGAVDSRQAQLRDGRGAAPASAMAATRAISGSRSIRSPSSTRHGAASSSGWSRRFRPSSRCSFTTGRRRCAGGPWSKRSKSPSGSRRG